MTEKEPVVVIGGGWAGLTAAVDLSEKGFKVTVIEAAKTVGGRARSVKKNNQILDNGQHVLLGAYSSTLEMVQRVGLCEKECFQREPLHLNVKNVQDSQETDIKFATFPAPFHAIIGLLSATGMSFAEKSQFIRICLRLKYAAAKKKSDDVSVLSFMHKHRHSQRLMDTIWAPLCLAALNTPLAEASLQIFSRVIADAFFASAAHSNIIFPKQGLSECFPISATQIIENKGGRILLGSRVTKLCISNNHVTGIALNNNTVIDSTRIILAVAPWALQRLCTPHRALSKIIEQTRMLGHYPIVTVYIQYPASVSLPQTMQGITGGINQWIIDRRGCGQPGLMACIISGPETEISRHINLSKQPLTRQISAELAQLFPHWPAPLSATVFKEKRATFICRPNINQCRPSTETAIHGLYLAGDFTATGYPATIESAIRSGLHASNVLRNTRTD